jgi:tripartite-type tricarboxylate transporter receptor subunit TctC
MEYIAMKEGIKWTHIPFATNPIAAFLGGHIDGWPAGILDLLPLIKAGKARLLLALNDFHWSDYPDVPHMLERGYDYYGMTYSYISGPKGISEPIIKKLEKIFLEATKDPHYIETAERFKLAITPLTGKECTDQWKRRYEQTREVVKALGLLRPDLH